MFFYLIFLERLPTRITRKEHHFFIKMQNIIKLFTVLLDFLSFPVIFGKCLCKCCYLFVLILHVNWKYRSHATLDLILFIFLDWNKWESVNRNHTSWFGDVVKCNAGSKEEWNVNAQWHSFSSLNDNLYFSFFTVK